MNHDLFASFRVQDQDSADALVRQQGNFRAVSDGYTRLKLLAPLVLCRERWARERAHYRGLVHVAGQQSAYDKDLISGELQRLERLGVLRPRIGSEVLASLPEGSFSVQFRFLLAEPFVSRDDAAFYPHDNPVRKEWAFKVPMMSGSGWKGNLRAALRAANGGSDSGEMSRLLGPPRPKGSVPDGYFRAGRLLFYPTYFDALDLLVLNPHDRERGSGRDPFYLECVPAGASGVFSLLYVPYDITGRDFAQSMPEVAIHLRQVSRAVRDMLTTLGFSAKRTSGFGLVREKVTAPGGSGAAELAIHAAGLDGGTTAPVRSFRFAGLGQLVSVAAEAARLLEAAHD